MQDFRGAPGAQLSAAGRPLLRHPVRRFGSRTIDFGREVVVMAIVNRTPDSFHDRGSTFPLRAALTAAESAIDAGAAWLDVGGQPFAAGARLPAAVELDRVLPVVTHIRRHSDVVLSVDTFEPEVASHCLAAGADVINDTTGLRDPALADVIGKEGGHVVITHSLAPSPRVPVPRPEYGDVVTEVASFLQDQVARAREHGIREDHIVLDPGHDLNKNTLHSLELTRRFAEIAALGFPTVAAVSNKDFVGESLGLPGPDRLAGSLAAAVICIVNGASIVRMHDVPAAVSAVRMTEAVLGLRPPARLRHNVDPHQAG